MSEQHLFSPKMNDLPADLISFLTSADSLVVSMNEGEVKKAEFLPLDELKLDRFRVDSEGHDDEGEAATSEEFEGYSLLKTADGYDPDGVLIWFPDLTEYGAWDCDHHILITFPNVTWSKILADPTWFINGQWHPERIVHRRVIPQQRD